MENANNTQSAIDAGMKLAGPQVVDNATAPYVLVPQGYRLESLEHMAEHPDRIKARPMFDEVESFIRYLKDFKVDNTRIFAQVQDTQLVVAALMDYHVAPDVPRWAEAHEATYVSKFDPKWARWAAYDKKPLPQAVFAEIIEDNLADIRDPAGAEMLEMARTLSAKTKVDFLSSVRLSNGNVQLQYEETTEAKAGEKGNLIVPEKFLLGLSVFEGGPLYPLECKLRYRIANKAVLFEYHRVNPEWVIRTAAQRVLELVEKETNIKPYIGIH